ncbi:MAG: hypothetical protein NUV85_02715 [Candidatus Berkelbacteria bacterium]|nr:hypothetical protein [Candidatus Berkelbacteria bacterium]
MSSDPSNASPPSVPPQPWYRLTLLETATLFVGYLYVTGYYVDAVFLGNLGVQIRELVRLDYIRIGFVFTLLSLTVTALPIGAFILTANVRRSSKLPHFYVGLVGNSLNTIVALGYLVFLAVFVTRYETNLVLPNSILGESRFQNLMAFVIVLSIFGMAVVPVLERLIFRIGRKSLVKWLFILVVEPLRFGTLLISCLIIFASLSQLPWVGALLHTGFIYIMVATTTGVLVAAAWARWIRRAPRSWVVYPLIGFGLMALYFFAITTYVLGTYTFIPINRGGRLPLTTAYLKTEKPIPGLPIAWYPDVGWVTGPLYIIEENDDSIYVGSRGMENWTTRFISLQAIRKDKIDYRFLDRIEDGFPRIARGK